LRDPAIIAGSGTSGVTGRRNAVVGWGVALLAIAAFARAGFWQLDRMHEKQAMLDAVAATLHERAPVPLARAADATRTRGYDWSAGRGHFADLPPVLLDNQSRNERPGVRAFRVFQPDAGVPLLVELGWLPVPGERTMPAVPMPAGAGSELVSGLLMPPPSAGLAKGVPVPVCQGEATASACEGGAHRDALLVIALEPARLAQALRLPTLAPRILKLDPAHGLAGGPAYARDLDILPNTLPPQRHLGYAVQWFGLAAAVLVTALVLTFRKRRPSP
jgi:cytochrome oxidase assembly protein ShyY1